MDDIKRMKELAELLNRAGKAYYAEDREIMSNYEYDSLYGELEELEKKTGTVLAGSPTLKVGYEAVEELPKETHPAPMLSLDKTKSREELRAFIGEHPCLLSWKMDGLTVVLTYREGELFKAVTRGQRDCRGSGHQQCQGICKPSPADSLSRGTDSQGGSFYYVFRF